MKSKISKKISISLLLLPLAFSLAAYGQFRQESDDEPVTSDASVVDEDLSFALKSSSKNVNMVRTVELFEYNKNYKDSPCVGSELSTRVFLAGDRSDEDQCDLSHSTASMVAFRIDGGRCIKTKDNLFNEREDLCWEISNAIGEVRKKEAFESLETIIAPLWIKQKKLIERQLRKK